MGITCSQRKAFQLHNEKSKQKKNPIKPKAQKKVVEWIEKNIRYLIDERREFEFVLWSCLIQLNREAITIYKAEEAEKPKFSY